MSKRRRRQKKNKLKRGLTPKEAISHLGRTGVAVGHAGERRVLKSFHHFGTPRWWQGIREATNEEDAQGIDHVVFTDVGDIFIQVKTSLSKGTSRSPKRNDRDVPIVYVNLEDSDVEIRKRVIRIISQEHRHILENSKANR